MTFYQELQLSSVASKQLIKATEDKKERRRHILIYNFKVYLVMAFCVAVVSLYSHFTGNNNSVVGVTVLLAVLVLRQADFGIRTTHGLASIVGIFGILIAGPKLSNMVSPVPAFFINVVCILLLMMWFLSTIPMQWNIIRIQMMKFSGCQSVQFRRRLLPTRHCLISMESRFRKIIRNMHRRASNFMIMV